MGTDRDYVSAAIARCLAIEAAGAPAREILRQGARTIALKSDAVVFAGEADGAALILRGVAAVYSEPRSGGEACLALFGPGDAIERTVALGERRGARRIVRALTNMEALLIDAKALQRARQADVAVAAALGEKSTEVAARFAEQSSDLALCDAETRLARRLVQMLSFLHGPTSRKTTLGKITQSQLAAVIGVSRKRINTILAMWFRSGLLFQDRSGVIDVLDARRLSAIADSEGALDDAPQFLGSIDHLLDAGLNDEAKTLALEAVEREPREAAYHHRAALAAARLGQLADALDLIAAADKLKPPPDIGEMIAGLKGRVLKNMADVADPPARPKIYVRAGEAYAAAYESYNGVYSAVNAAACFAIAGDGRAGGFAARSLGAQAGEDAPQTYYELASIGEARLLQNDLSAPEWFVAALAAPDATAAKTGATRGQLKRFAAAGVLAPERVDALVPQSAVACFSGPVFAEDPGAETGIACWAQAALHDNRIVHAVGSLAAGADIIIAETFLDAGAEITAVFPCVVDEFAATSVRPYGDAWARRFEAVLARCVQTRAPAAPSAADYERAAVVAMGAARKYAHDLNARAVGLFALRDDCRGRSLSARMGDLWRSFAGETDTITLETELASTSPDRGPSRPLRFGAVALGSEAAAVFDDPLEALRAAEALDADAATVVLDIASGDDARFAADFPYAAVKPLAPATGVLASPEFCAAVWLRGGRALTEFTTLGFVPTELRTFPCQLYAWRRGEM